MNAFAESAKLTAAIRRNTGTLVGIAVRDGLFSVTRTTKAGRKTETEHLTGWQSHADCLSHMRQMVEG